jgi:hypothetical protein
MASAMAASAAASLISRLPSPLALAVKSVKVSSPLFLVIATASVGTLTYAVVSATPLYQHTPCAQINEPPFPHSHTLSSSPSTSPAWCVCACGL